MVMCTRYGLRLPEKCKTDGGQSDNRNDQVVVGSRGRVFDEKAHQQHGQLLQVLWYVTVPQYLQQAEE